MRQRRTDTSLNEGGKVIGVTAVNSVREEGCLPLRYSICAYLRSSRQGAFCGHSAMPNAALFTPVAPLHENLFCKNIFVIAAVLFSKSDRRVLYCCHLSSPRENTLSGIYAVQWVVSLSHDFFPRQFAEKSVNPFTPSEALP